MNSRLFLKVKNDEVVVYMYSMDRSDAPSDGEVQYSLKTGERKILKTATGDDNGWHAEWLVLRHLRRIIFDENCPEKHFLAIG
ncbi:MAG: hypothetical protein LBC70_04605 [Chitinispirillales bacterium]|jgi:hypothetical protein|nr:hypothetical protein [Chitinispirillales bacterium]